MPVLLFTRHSLASAYFDNISFPENGIELWCWAEALILPEKSEFKNETRKWCQGVSNRTLKLVIVEITGNCYTVFQSHCTLLLKFEARMSISFCGIFWKWSSCSRSMVSLVSNSLVVSKKKFEHKKICSLKIVAWQSQATTRVALAQM